MEPTQWGCLLFFKTLSKKAILGLQPDCEESAEMSHTLLSPPHTAAPVISTPQTGQLLQRRNLH